MKKVINPCLENTITIQEVINSNAPIVGFQLKNDKVTLIPWKCESSLYLARCVYNWEKGNGFNPNGENHRTIAEWEKFFRDFYKAEMFVFDSPKELFKWLAE